MRDSAIRVLKLVGFGSACIVLGLYWRRSFPSYRMCGSFNGSRKW